MYDVYVVKVWVLVYFVMTSRIAYKPGSREPSQIESLHIYFRRWQLTYRDLEIERELSHRSRNAAITNYYVNFGFVFLHADHDKRLS